MKTEYTDEQLQIALVKELPELIAIVNNAAITCVWKSDTIIAARVTEREWDWIVRESNQPNEEARG